MHTIWHTADGLLDGWFFFFSLHFEYRTNLFIKIIFHFAKPFHGNDFYDENWSTFFSTPFFSMQLKESRVIKEQNESGDTNKRMCWNIAVITAKQALYMLFFRHLMAFECVFFSTSTSLHSSTICKYMYVGFFIPSNWQTKTSTKWRRCLIPLKCNKPNWIWRIR